MSVAPREFDVADAHQYDQRSTLRWVFSHVARYPVLPIVFVVTVIGMAATQSGAAVAIGQAFDTLLDGGDVSALGRAALLVALAYLGYGLFDIVNSMAIRILGQRVERDARDELYLSLLGKSLSFHSRQRVGDLMARATGDVQQLGFLITPSAGLILESLATLIVPIIAIGLINVELLLVPLIFLVAVTFALNHYNNQLRPIAGQLRERYGALNSQLAETIGGVEVVKGFAQEPVTQRQFSGLAAAYRAAFVQEGAVRARYLPLLVYGLTVGIAFGHALLLVRAERISIGDVIAFMALLDTLQTPIFFSLNTFSQLQQGFAGAARLRDLILARTDLDEERSGHRAPLQGDIRFEQVSFGYDDNLILRNLSFAVPAGATVAIVGQTGSGKTSLTRLVNRIFDVNDGRVLVDEVDVREWSLEALRSQVAVIEQDIFLFSRSVAENIAFGSREPVERTAIEAAARAAQAHEFIVALPEGYETVIGERGVTLSGGQRQRLAIARALLSQPRILIIDDSTSALDSATEAQIQQALRTVMAGRTTLLITHRVSQIRQADLILVLKNGQLVASGSHEHLLTASPLYRQIFLR